MCLLLIIDMTGNARGDPDTDNKKNQLRGNTFDDGNSEASKHSAGGAPESNSNALTHGVTADPTGLLDEFEPEERQFVEQLAGALLDIAPFGTDDPRFERLQLTCVKAVQERRGEREIARDGPTVERVVGTREDGTPITQDEEHYLAKFTSRLSKDIRLNLKDLGCLPDPESQQAEATESLASVLAGENE